MRGTLRHQLFSYSLQREEEREEEEEERRSNFSRTHTLTRLSVWKRREENSPMGKITPAYQSYGSIDRFEKSPKQFDPAEDSDDDDDDECVVLSMTSKCQSYLFFCLTRDHLFVCLY